MKGRKLESSWVAFNVHVGMAYSQANHFNDAILRHWNAMRTRRVREQNGASYTIEKTYIPMKDYCGCIAYWECKTEITDTKTGGIMTSYTEKVVLPMVVVRDFDGIFAPCVVNSYTDMSWDNDGFNHVGDTIEIWRSE